MSRHRHRHSFHPVEAAAAAGRFVRALPVAAAAAGGGVFVLVMGAITIAIHDTNQTQRDMVDTVEAVGEAYADAGDLTVADDERVVAVSVPDGMGHRVADDVRVDGPGGVIDKSAHIISIGDGESAGTDVVLLAVDDDVATRVAGRSDVKLIAGS